MVGHHIIQLPGFANFVALLDVTHFELLVLSVKPCPALYIQLHIPILIHVHNNGRNPSALGDGLVLHPVSEHVPPAGGASSGGDRPVEEGGRGPEPELGKARSSTVLEEGCLNLELAHKPLPDLAEHVARARGIVVPIKEEQIFLDVLPRGPILVVQLFGVVRGHKIVESPGHEERRHPSLGRMSHRRHITDLHPHLLVHHHPHQLQRRRHHKARQRPGHVVIARRQGLSQPRQVGKCGVQNSPRNLRVAGEMEEAAGGAHGSTPDTDVPVGEPAAQVVDDGVKVIALVPAEGDVVAVTDARPREIEGKQRDTKRQQDRDSLHGTQPAAGVPVAIDHHWTGLVAVRGAAVWLEETAA
mmetsp:Transcript_4073/g.9888  ORF Transcript_4073/g.9888 Transcript_4073/m.9888 type:complete len:357 (-) Transcript_4073:186-1256(-)